MTFPEPIADFLDVFRQPWKPVSATAVFIAAFLYGWFLLYAFTHTGAGFFIDGINLPIHEGGHLVFGIFGSEELTVWGGTLMQCLVPFALAMGFAYRREISGTAFFTYGLAWGINHKLLDRQKYLPVVSRSWKGMLTHVYKDGRLGCIQPVGAAPGQYKASSSYVYGIGAFLLAGSELDTLSRHQSHAR